MINLRVRPGWDDTFKMLKTAGQLIQKIKLDKYGKRGVDALRAATPVDSGKTAESWEYHIYRHPEKGTLSIQWTNSNLDDNDMPIAILLQYGHAGKDGTYVQGVDYINPAIKPIFDDMADDIWTKFIKGTI